MSCPVSGLFHSLHDCDCRQKELALFRAALYSTVVWFVSLVHLNLSNSISLRL